MIVSVRVCGRVCVCVCVRPSLISTPIKMSRHSKNNCAAAIFTYAEKQKAGCVLFRLVQI
jgi:hypothetical protein